MRKGQQNYAIEFNLAVCFCATIQEEVGGKREK
jgi:hypothetical protein